MCNPRSILENNRCIEKLIIGKVYGNTKIEWVEINVSIIYQGLNIGLSFLESILQVSSDYDGSD